MRAAEAAADAAEAAEAAAEAEEEAQTSSPREGALRSPPAASYECRDRISPARSAFWLTEKDNEGATETHKGSGIPKRHSPRANEHPPTYRAEEEDGGERGDGDSHQGRVGRRGKEEGLGGGKDEGRWRREGNERRSNEEEKLKNARDQVGSCIPKILKVCSLSWGAEDRSDILEQS